MGMWLVGWSSTRTRMAERATKTFPIGLTTEQREELQGAADAAGKSLAAWIRETALLAARGQLVPTAEGLGQLADAAKTPLKMQLATSPVKVFKGPDPKPSQRKAK